MYSLHYSNQGYVYELHHDALEYCVVYGINAIFSFVQDACSDKLDSRMFTFLNGGPRGGAMQQGPSIRYAVPHMAYQL